MIFSTYEMRRLLRASLCCSLALLTLIPAAGLAGEPEQLDTLATLTNSSLTAEIENLKHGAGELHTAIIQLCSKPDTEHLQLARQSWSKAFLAVRQTEPLRLTTELKRSRDLTRVTNAIVLDAALADAQLADLLAQKESRGYLAIEQMLFAPQDAAAATTPNRCAHLQTTAAELKTWAQQVFDLWQNELAPGLRNAGDGQPYLAANEPLNLLMAGLLNSSEWMLRDRISVPSGLFETAAKPELLEGGTSNSAVAAFTATIDGMAAILGTPDSMNGLLYLVATQDGLVSKKDPGLAEDIVDRMDDIRAILADLGKASVPLATSLTMNNKVLKKLYKEVNKLQKLLIKASLVLELNVTEPDRFE